MTDECLLNIVVSPEVEDVVADWLLERPEVAGFSSFAISGHGSSEAVLSLAEQVAGRRRQVLFQLHLPGTQAYGLIAAIKTAHGGTGMHYWLSPLLDAGHLM